jgi:predicted GIY-YIG superfamily endonuclease
MATRQVKAQFYNKAIRNWTLYVVRFTDGIYYVGITSRSNYMIRIKQHGGPLGAKVNRGKVLDKVIETRHLGPMTGRQAGDIENDVTLECRKKYGGRKVKGGYDIYKGRSIVPTYTPGSKQSIILILACLLAAIVMLVAIIKVQQN